MCSTTSARLARIYRAIEELESRSGQGAAASAGTSVAAVAGPTADSEAADCEGRGVAHDDVAGRLAEIWAMIADADPELAKRLPRYLGPHA